jgi:hypothetical protein
MNLVTSGPSQRCACQCSGRARVTEQGSSSQRRTEPPGPTATSRSTSEPREDRSRAPPVKDDVDGCDVVKTLRSAHNRTMRRRSGVGL